ncbi:tagatose 1,6-diphosphate aldolase [Muricoccus radiodurans]|uniref:tagatose 1,6-diphosphate aldolase n=1 Tax=Muricoccus radiodurans TaxID=2231721 RepID=UPI003CEB70D3
MAISAGKLRGLNRLSDRAGFFRMVAVDQRPPIRNRIRETRGEAAVTWENVGAVKAALLRALQPYASAMLLDPGYALPYAHRFLDPAKGMLLTLEQFEFDMLQGGRLTKTYPAWSPATIRRAGADGVKLMLFYRPDAPAAVNDRQHAFVREVGEGCRAADIPLLLEPLVYPLGEEDASAYAESADKRPELVIETVREFRKPEYGIDIFKLETPVPNTLVPAPEGEGSDVADTQAAFAKLDELLDRPWVMLSAGAGMEPFRRILTYAFRAGASGYLAGRAIWADAFRAYPDMDLFESRLRTGGIPYMAAINALLTEYGTPWTSRPFARDDAMEGEGEGWVASYPG